MPRDIDGAPVLGGCLALVGLVGLYLAVLSFIVWLIATIIHGVFF